MNNIKKLSNGDFTKINNFVLNVDENLIIEINVSDLYAITLFRMVDCDVDVKSFIVSEDGLFINGDIHLYVYIYNRSTKLVKCSNRRNPKIKTILYKNIGLYMRKIKLEKIIKKNEQ